VALSGWLLALVLQHGGRAVYDLPGAAVALGVAAAVLAVVAWAVVAVRGGWLGIVTAVVGALVVASAVTVPVVAVVVLVGGVVAMASRQQRATDKPALAAGLVAAIAVPAAALVATDGPVVTCHPGGGVSTESSFFRNSGSGGDQASGSGSAVQGRLQQGGRTYTYRCAGGRLVEFTAR
jgi:hypothetical protein